MFKKVFHKSFFPIASLPPKPLPTKKQQQDPVEFVMPGFWVTSPPSPLRESFSVFYVLFSVS